MKHEFGLGRTKALAALAILAAAVGCGGNVQGNTYADNGGIVKIEFKSGGKAYVSTGPATTNCSYTESVKTVTLLCEGDKTTFTVDGDGALNGPPGGFMSRLIKQK